MQGVGGRVTVTHGSYHRKDRIRDGDEDDREARPQRPAHHPLLLVVVGGHAPSRPDLHCHQPQRRRQYEEQATLEERQPDQAVEAHDAEYVRLRPREGLWSGMVGNWG